MNRNQRTAFLLVAALVCTGAAFAASLAVGRYPIDWAGLWQGGMSARVFFTLRLPRTAMALLTGVGLGLAGSVYQTVFRNPLAAPDILGVAGGASVGAAAAILWLGGGVLCTALCAFCGGFAAVLAALALAALSRRSGIFGVVLAGIAVNAVTEAALMLLKLSADPDRQLAAIEFWTMGSFAHVTAAQLLGILPAVLAGLAGLCVLHRPIGLLAQGDEQARMLGVPVGLVRTLALLLATLVVGSLVSVTGLVAFIGLLAPHIARLLAGSDRFSTTVLAGLCGGALLLAADVLARSISGAEVPVSVVTSLLGAPFLFWLMCRREARYAE